MAEQIIEMLLPTSKITIQKLADVLFDQMQVSVSVLRLDKLHPIVSGNKLFKLHYLIQSALRQRSEGIVSFGGAYSNHLVATAFACKEIGLKSTGFVRGEQPVVLSHTLQACRAYGMELKFISRQQYDQKEHPEFLNSLQLAYPKYVCIPEGGYHPMGAEGAALINNWIPSNTSHICCAVGTATTLSGLARGLKKEQQLVGFPVIKNMEDIEQRMALLSSQPYDSRQLHILKDYHFGGYAKKTKTLIDSMNVLYERHQLPTDFVYTGKMMFGVMDCISKGFFQKGSDILCVHTGGLQGNVSLGLGSLIF
jgi:1-aminocyclopropane-1-carboxylate deaminase